MYAGTAMMQVVQADWTTHPVGLTVSWGAPAPACLPFPPSVCLFEHFSIAWRFMRAIRHFLTSGTVALLLASAVAAQGKPSAKPAPEIGTMVGVTIVSQSGFSTTNVGVPRGIVRVSSFSPTLYGTIFSSPSVIVELQVADYTT